MGNTRQRFCPVRGTRPNSTERQRSGKRVVSTRHLRADTRDESQPDCDDDGSASLSLPPRLPVLFIRSIKRPARRDSCDDQPSEFPDHLSRRSPEQGHYGPRKIHYKQTAVVRALVHVYGSRRTSARSLQRAVCSADRSLDRRSWRPAVTATPDRTRGCLPLENASPARPRSTTSQPVFQTLARHYLCFPIIASRNASVRFGRPRPASLRKRVERRGAIAPSAPSRNTEEMSKVVREIRNATSHVYVVAAHERAHNTNYSEWPRTRQ